MMSLAHVYSNRVKIPAKYQVCARKLVQRGSRFLFSSAVGNHLGLFSGIRLCADQQVCQWVHWRVLCARTLITEVTGQLPNLFSKQPCTTTKGRAISLASHYCRLFHISTIEYEQYPFEQIMVNFILRYNIVLIHFYQASSSVIECFH